jgi:hypothetical protein
MELRLSRRGSTVPCILSEVAVVVLDDQRRQVSSFETSHVPSLIHFLDRYPKAKLCVLHGQDKALFLAEPWNLGGREWAEAGNGIDGTREPEDDEVRYMIDQGL